MKKLLLAFLLLLLCCSDIAAQVDFRKETIYFLLTPRFYDGDSTNNAPNEWCSYIPGVNNANITDPKDVTWRGDFKGLIQKLDYIKDMGFTAIWINPVVQNRSPLDYHGYHAWDFTKIDTRLESPGATFQDLINAVHAKGMKLVLDIVTNHSSRYGINGVAELKYNTDPTKPWGKDLNGNVLQDNPNWEYDGLNPNPDDGKRWSRANLAKMPAPYNQNLAAWNWPSTESFVHTSNPNWFHHSGNGFVQGWDDTTNCYQRAISDDCPDLHTGSTVLRDYMYNAYAQYIQMGVDAFRWDTWKHMNKEDIIHLTDRFKALNPNLFIFGEVAQKRFELHPVTELNPHWYTWRGGVGTSAPLNVGVLDFYAEATFHNIFENGGGFSGVTDAARYDNLYGDPSLLVTWLDNHDFGPNNDWNRRYGGSDENLAACMNFMFTWRGIPTVYYGTESRFKAGQYTDIHEPSSIQKSLDLTGRAYYGNEFSNAPNHIIYRHLKKLNAIRKAIPALQSGSWQWGGNYPGNGIGFTRTLNGTTVAVGLAKDGAASFNFSGLPNAVYRDAVTGRSFTVTNGTLAFTVTSGSAGIYVQNGPGMIGGSGGGFFEACAAGCSNVPPTVNISPIGDNYSAPVSVSMNATGGNGSVTIYYTTNETTPTASSTVYTGPFTVSSTTIVKAIAIDANGNTSDMDGEQYTFVLPKPKLTISPAAGNYYNPINVTFSATTGTSPYQFYYTTNGSTPTTASTLYTSPIAVNTSTTVRAIAVDANLQVSDVKTNNYTFIIPNPTVTANPLGGNFYLGTTTVTLTASSPRMPVTIYYTTNGATPTTASAVYTTPLTFNGPTAVTLKYFGVDNEGRVGDIVTQTYTFDPIPDIWVYFKKPANWASPVKIHYWNAVPSGAVVNTTWPGVNTTLQCAGGDWWKFRFSGVTSINVIFNDGAGKQTADLVGVNSTRYYDNSWLNYIPDIDEPIARLTASAISGPAPLTVNFNAATSSGCTPLGFFWDFGNGNNLQTGINPTASQSYSIPGIYAVRLIVQDQNNKRDTITQNINVTAAASNMIVHFRRPATWTNTPRLYFWNATPTGAATTTWPGVQMVSEGNGWWVYTINGVQCSNLIFNNANAPQTADLYNCNECWYDNGWITPLPLTLLNFDAQRINNQVNVSWKTAQESNMNFYAIERSVDGNHFEVIGTVSANNVSTTQQYQFTDKQLPAVNQWYYRLAMQEKNGLVAYSKLITVKSAFSSNINMYPNPVKHHFFINNESTQIKQYQLALTDVTGRLMLSQSLTFNGRETKQINLTKSIKSGYYFLRLTAKDGGVITEKILVE
jgi:glycosidase